MKQFSAILILVLIFSPSILSAQGRTIEIKIIDKQYVPPARTPKIPQEFKDKEARFVVRAGDGIKICNADKFFAKPTSLSKENKFQGIEGSGGLPPGSCITVKAQNPGNKPISFWLHDNIHLKSRLFLVVLPANWPDEGEENTPPEEVRVIDDQNGDNSVYSKLSGYWELESGSPYGGNTQLTVSSGVISGTSQRSATAVIKITGGSYDAATKKLSFTYLQEWSQRTGKASFDFGENSANYILTGTWVDDVSGRGTWIMMKKK
jgi:hypothetical protein